MSDGDPWPVELADIREKVRFARQETELACAEFDLWAGGLSIGARGAFDPASGSCVIRVQDAVPTTPAVIAAGLSSVVHHLRSSMDHLVCRLLERHGGQVSRETAFPIFNQRMYDRGAEVPFLVRTGRKTKGGRGNGMLCGLPPRVAAGFEIMQPYFTAPVVVPTPEQHPLAELHTLWNTEKHRTLLVVAGGALDSVTTRVSPDSGCAATLARSSSRCFLSRDESSATYPGM